MARKKDPEQYEQIKKSIVMAAVDMIAKKNFTNFKVADVAETLGLSKAAVYWYFSSKDALMEALAAYLFQVYIDGAQEIYNSGLTPVEKLRQIILGTGDEIQNALMAMVPIKLYLEIYTEHNAMKELVKKGYQEYYGILSKILNDGIASGYFRADLDVNHFVMFLAGAIDGLAFQNLIVSSEKIQVPRTFIISMIESILLIKP